jgi:toxin ParE1/3/4
MIVFWSDVATADLQHLHDWLSGLPNASPDDVIRRIRAAAESMERLGDIGRPSGVPGTRLLSIHTDPYVVVYRLKGEDMEVLAVYHTAQDR